MILIFSVFAPRPTWGQTAEKSMTTPSQKKEQLQNLKQRFQKEDLVIAQKRQFLLANQKARIVAQDGTISEFHKLSQDGTAMYYTTYSNNSTLANSGVTQNGIDLGLSGYGLKAGVWDAGKALENHQEFGSRVKSTDSRAEIDSHATMVTGIIASAGIEERAQGVAFEAEVISNDWLSDRVEVIEAIQEGILVSNHSYGIRTNDIPDWYFGAYLPISKNWDEIMFNAPYYLMVAAAGNGQNSEHNDSPIYGKTVDGFDLLVGFGTSKNGLLVTGANTTYDEQGILENSNVTNYSSFGPTDDGRVKPDLAGNGNLIYSATASNEQSYGSAIGTSMASPGVSGSLLLLQEYHQQLHGGLMRAATLKGLALHTAYDVFAPGPDYKLGWGVFNLHKAADVIAKKDFSSKILEDTLSQTEVRTYKVTASGEEPLMVSLSWTDPEGELAPSGVYNSGIAALVNDLDVRIEKDGTIFYPYKLNPLQAEAPASNGDNGVDPFERVDIQNAAGEYTITISHKGQLKHGGQEFSLVVTGGQFNACRLEAPLELELLEATEEGCAFSWKNQADTLFEVQFRNKKNEHWSSDSILKNNYYLNDLVYDDTYEFKVRSICSESVESEFTKTYSFVFKGRNTRLVSNEIEDEITQIRPYPNPTTDYLQLGDAMAENSNFKVLDLAGNVRKQGKVSGAIQVSELNPGVYIITVTNQNGTKSAKFFKN